MADQTIAEGDAERTEVMTELAETLDVCNYHVSRVLWAVCFHAPLTSVRKMIVELKEGTLDWKGLHKLDNKAKMTIGICE